MSYLDYQEQKTRGTFDFPIEFHHVDKSHPRYQMPFHWHIDYELLRVVSGHLSLSLNEDTYSLSAGDTALIQDGVLHGGTPTDCVYECIDMDLSAFVGGNAVCKKELENVQNHQIELQRIFRKDTQEAAVLWQLFDTLCAQENGFACITQGLLLQFIGLMIQNRRYHGAVPLSSRGDKRIRQLKNALGLIRERYNTPLSLEELAAAAEMSPKYFCRFFAEMTGRTPIDYLNYYRVECACEQLLYSDETVTDIALGCGFNDLSYFVKTFKKYKGTTPKQFRKEATA